MLALALILPLSAGAQVSPNQCKCMVATGTAQGKFIAAKMKCIAKCNAGARAGKNPASDCTPPVYQGATGECVNKVYSKALLKEAGCRACPDCYAGGNCIASSSFRTATTENQVDAFIPIVFCDDAASPDQLNDDEAKCQQETAKNGGKFAAAKMKCYAKCRKAECKGTIPAGSCTAGAVADPTGKTQACISKADAKCVAKVGGKCTDPPECYTADPSTNPPTNFCAAIEAMVDGNDPATYCGSPSAAFLE